MVTFSSCISIISDKIYFTDANNLDVSSDESDQGMNILSPLNLFYSINIFAKMSRALVISLVLRNSDFLYLLICLVSNGNPDSLMSFHFMGYYYNITEVNNIRFVNCYFQVCLSYQYMHLIQCREAGDCQH